MIALTVNAAHAAGIPVTVCGELAAIPEAAGKLIALGVDALSVPVGRI
jgi:phosphoenolpyruvate-protein kinase (PTS system EI component)